MTRRLHHDKAYARHLKLLDLGYRDYAQYLVSPHWLATKALYRDSELPQDCLLCGHDVVDLHHTTYARIGAEDLEDLVPLCRRCHVMVHVLEQCGDISLDLAGLENAERGAAWRRQVEAAEAERLAEVDAGHLRFEALSVEQRIRRVQRQAAQHGVDIGRIEESIRQRIRSMERKVLRLQREDTGDAHHHRPARIAALDGVERACRDA